MSHNSHVGFELLSLMVRADEGSTCRLQKTRLLSQAVVIMLLWILFLWTNRKEKIRCSITAVKSTRHTHITAKGKKDERKGNEDGRKNERKERKFPDVVRCRNVPHSTSTYGKVEALPIHCIASTSLALHGLSLIHFDHVLG